jgi:iron complex outermembrane receptor protein
MKSRFADDRLQLNVAAFYNEISDMQVSVFLEGSGGAASNVQNAGEATFQGFEVELAWQVLDALRLSANYGYLDGEYDEFIENGVNVKNQKDLPYAPENTASVMLDWNVGNWGWGNLDLHVDWNYNDEYLPYIEPSQNATSQIDSYDIINASLILSEVALGSNMSMQFGIWGKNITDEEYRQNTIPFGLWTISYYGAPATYGFDARLNF